MNKLSEDLLLNVKMEKDTSSFRKELESITPEKLQDDLKNDDQKKAFWINIYNAYYQIIRKEMNIGKPDIYKKQLFKIAGKPFSLDNVEHGILRRNKYKYSLGFFSNILTSNYIKENMVEKLDYRIHFALNCGAASCPPIAFYRSASINEELDLATQSFLEGETTFDEKKKEIETTALFKWFYADFGGTKGIKKIYADQLNKDISNYKIKYTEYSWEDDLGNFA